MSIHDKLYVGVAFYEIAPEARQEQDVSGVDLLPSSPSTSAPAPKARRKRPRKIKDPYSRMVFGSCVRGIVGCHMKTRKFAHCEIIVGGGTRASGEEEEELVAYGIVYGRKLFREKRKFTDKNYKLIMLYGNDYDERPLIEFCDGEIGKIMDFSGMLWSRIWPKRTNGKRWFCAEFTAAALQKIGFFPGENPASVSIEDIYYAIKSTDGNMEIPTPKVRSDITGMLDS